MSATMRTDHDAGLAVPGAPAALWRSWVRQVDDIAERMGEDDASFARGAAMLRDAAADLRAAKVATVAAKAPRNAGTRTARAHLCHALRVGARMDARRVLGANRAA